MGDNTSKLEGVVDFAPNNVWAVGLTGISLCNGNQVIEHFDGSKWNLFPGPKFQSTDQPALESLTTVSASDMWAAGFILTNSGQSLFPLFEHFDGTSWKALETFDQGAAIYGVCADATNDVWAVGTLAFGATVIEHFNGTSWSVVSSPSPGLGEDVLTGVTALAPNNVWAVGFYAKDVNTDRLTKTLIKHGTAPVGGLFSVPTLDLTLCTNPTTLWGITAVSANDVWAFGDYYAADGSGQIFTLVLHWDGISWKIVPSPSPANSNTRVDILFGGTAIPRDNLWLVGNEFGRTLVLNATGQ
jgi:hypothetical protein